MDNPPRKTAPPPAVAGAPPANDNPVAGPVVISQLFVSFISSALVLAIDLGVPLTEAQKADILTLVVTGWAFVSTAIVLWRAARRPRGGRDA